MDIKQIYPSIKPAKVALVAKMMWNKSDISVKNVDVEKLLKYVSKEISKEKLKWLNLDPVLFKRKLVVKKIKDKKQKPKKKSFSDIWSSPERPPNQAEIKTLIGLVIENIILLGMGNHLYQFGNQVRLQNDTGATGYDMTGLCADVYMVWWMDKFVNKLNQLNIKLDVNVRFKDDLNLMTKALPLGTRYDPKNKELHYTNPSLKCFANFSSQSERQIYETENPEVITFYILSQIANDIDSMISFTYDVPSNYEPKMVPILDLNVYLNQDGYIMHEFYEKPTNSNLVILANSALSFKVKRTVFTQECLRRLRNTSLSLGPDVANKFLSKYMLKLKDSGYSQKFRAEIIRSAKNAFNLQIQNDRKGIRPLFRDKKRILQDQKEKGVGVIDWWNKAYYEDSNKQRFSTILFVPPTPGAKLAKQMQKREAELNAHSDTRIKVVETDGHRYSSPKYPYPTLPCIKQLCPFCKETVVSVPKENSAQLSSTQLSSPVEHQVLAILFHAWSARRMEHQQSILVRLEGQL